MGHCRGSVRVNAGKRHGLKSSDSTSSEIEIEILSLNFRQQREAMVKYRQSTDMRLFKIQTSDTGRNCRQL